MHVATNHHEQRNCRCSVSTSAWYGGHSTKCDPNVFFPLKAMRLCDSISFILMSFSVRVMSGLWLSFLDVGQCGLWQPSCKRHRRKPNLQSSVLLARTHEHIISICMEMFESKMSKDIMLLFLQMRTISLSKK